VSRHQIRSAPHVARRQVLNIRETGAVMTNVGSAAIEDFVISGLSSAGKSPHGPRAAGRPDAVAGARLRCRSGTDTAG
jgi:hypothetical protein